MSSPYGNHVESVSFIFGRHADPEKVQGFIQPISKLFSDRYGEISAYPGSAADMIDLNLFGLRKHVDYDDLCDFFSEIPDDFFGDDQPEVRIWSCTMAHRIKDFKPL